jgi:hypothetical protein
MAASKRNFRLTFCMAASRIEVAMENAMSNLQLFLAMGVPVIFNGLLFVMLLTKVNQLENKFDANFNLLVGKLMDMDNRLSKVEAKLGI